MITSNYLLLLTTYKINHISHINMTHNIYLPLKVSLKQKLDQDRNLNQEEDEILIRCTLILKICEGKYHQPLAKLVFYISVGMPYFIIPKQYPKNMRSGEPSQTS